MATAAQSAPAQGLTLIEYVKSLKQAIEEKDPIAGNVTGLLQQMKDMPNPTEAEIRNTKAGVIVGKLRSSQIGGVARLSREIVTKWRKSVEAAKEAAKNRNLLAGGSNSAGVGTGNVAGPDAASSPASSTPTSGVAPQTSQPFTGDPLKRHFRTDGVDEKRTSDTLRNNSIGMLYNGLAYRATESVEEVLARAVECESALFNVHDRNSSSLAYKKKLRSLFTALKRKDNRRLGVSVMTGEIPPPAFVVMNDEQLASEEQRQKDRALQHQNMLKAQVPMAEKSISRDLKCGKCGENKVSYSQAQTRSADEPMTTFCECVVCGNRWKFS